MSEQQMVETDIVIVGAALVGSAMACALAQQDPQLRITVVEAGLEPSEFHGTSFDPRVVALTRASQQLLQSIGAWPRIVEKRVSPYTDMEVWDASGTGVIHFNCDEIQQPDLGHIVENSVVNGALLSCLSEHANVTLRRPARVVSLLSNIDGTRLRLDDGTDLHATLVIAADGANSQVRQMAGIDISERDYHHSAIVTTARTAEPNRATAWQVFLQSGPLAFLPLDSGLKDGQQRHFSSIVWSCVPQLAEELMGLDNDAFCRRLERAFESRLGTVEAASERYCFPLRQRHALEYFHQGVVVVGDAAHTIHPLAGQGVNLGFLDVVALKDELIRARRRGLSLADESVLKRYQRERKSHNMAMMGAMEGFKRLFEADPLPVRWLRNQGLKTLDNLSPLKNTLIKQAMGFQSILPFQ